MTLQGGSKAQDTEYFSERYFEVFINISKNLNYHTSLALHLREQLVWKEAQLLHFCSCHQESIYAL